MKTKIQLDGKVEISRFISLLSLGVSTALKEGVISTDEANAYLFNPFTVVTLKSLGIPPRILDLIYLGRELEDVKAFIPHALPSALEHIETRSLKALRALPKTTSPHLKKWFLGIKRQANVKTMAKSANKRPSP